MIFQAHGTRPMGYAGMSSSAVIAGPREDSSSEEGLVIFQTRGNRLFKRGTNQYVYIKSHRPV